VRRRLMARVFECAAKILGRSESLLEDLRGLGCPQEKLRLNRTGIPLEEFPYSAPCETEDGRWVFFQAGRLIEKKGFGDTLRAFVEIRKALPNAVLRIAGEGPLGGALQAEAAALGVADAVEWLGFLRQQWLVRELSSAHVFLHPSVTAGDGNREGVPNAMLEAMALGVPVVATRHGGIGEAVDHGVSGLLVEEGDFAGLAEAAIGLVGSREQREAMSLAGRKVVEEKFSREASVAALEAVYDEICPVFRRA